MPDSAANAEDAQALYDVFDYAGAEAAAGRRVSSGDPTPDDLWLLGMAQRMQRRFEPAIDTFTRFLSLAGGDPRVEQVQSERLHCVRKLQRYEEAERFARAAADAFPANGYFTRVLGEALLMRGQRAEAERWLQHTLRTDPSETEARAMLRALSAAGEGAAAAAPVKTVAWPQSLPKLGDMRQAIRHSLLRGYPQTGRFIGADSRFLTLGSCFANNLAVRLRAAGYNADTEFLGEEVNSTYANRYLLEWIEKGAVDSQTEAMHDAYGEEMRQRFREGFAACDVFVFTLGLAPCFFSRATGDFFFMNGSSALTTRFLRQNCEMRSTSVAENQANLQAIVQAVERLAGPAVRIVLTVSPVPLAASTEFASAVIADCISKSILRVACHEALKRMDARRALYWPSFEMVRWLGAHFGHDFEPAFGADDANNRHVSTWLVDTIIDLFLETYSEAAGQA
jgi:tetratricopeptide (TPR) repeat protein